MLTKKFGNLRENNSTHHGGGHENGENNKTYSSTGTGKIFK